MLIKMTSDLTKEDLAHQEYSESAINVLFRNPDWFEFEKMDSNTLGEFNKMVYENQDRIKINIDNYNGELELAYEDTIKKLFLMNFSLQYSKIRTDQAVRVMRATNNFEINNDKCVRNFTLDEIKRYAIEIFNNISYHKVELHISILNQYQNFYDNLVEKDSDKIWSRISNSFIIKALEETAQGKILTKVQVKDIYEASANPQTVIPLVLAFEGVNLKDDEDIDEMRYLRESDLDGNELRIRNRNNEDRTIFIDNATRKMVKEAINQDAFIVTNADFKRGDIIPIEKSNRIIKRGELGSPSESSKEGAVSYRAVYKRLLESRELAKYVVGDDISLTYRNIRKFGMFHYINVHLVEGYNLEEAIEMTLVRFGDWYTDGDEKSHRNNVQLVRRMTNQYKAHMGFDKKKK